MRDEHEARGVVLPRTVPRLTSFLRI